MRHLPMIAALLVATAAPADVLHRIEVTLDPDGHRLSAEDQIELDGATAPEFVLHAGLAPRVLTPGVALEPAGTVAGAGAVPLERFRLRLPEGVRAARIGYGGTIHHPLGRHGSGVGHPGESTPGLIGPDGVFLDGGSGWFPRFDAPTRRFTLTVALPPGWLAVSQGDGPDLREEAERNRVRWSEPQPQDDIYLIAAPFHLYRKPTLAGEAQVYLRAPEPELARRYLDATGDYLELYSDLIAPYPYAKFALVENFWQSGYGMPSFTLLGGRVLRLPFIIHTSYPHEILHNWWGNGVFVDYASGNWSEGLTSYLADHLLRERRGAGADHRRAALQRYAEFVRAGNDFPLRAFRARHSGASQSVGYDKGMMLYHMLRQEVGKVAFFNGLTRFFEHHRFRRASFADLQAAFEATAGRDLAPFFEQWLDRTGAPRLELVDAHADGRQLVLTLRQNQPGARYRLRVPLEIGLASGGRLRTTVALDAAEQRFELALAEPPIEVAVDPGFDLFRALDPAEIPPALGALLGAERLLILLPSAAPAERLAAYRTLAEQWLAEQPGWTLALDRDHATLPDDRAVWLFGSDNRHAAGLRERLRRATIEPDPAREAVVLVDRIDGAARGWFMAPSPETIATVGRKLPHYGRYGYLLFAGDGQNRVKGSWPVLDSPLRRALASNP